MGLGRGAGPHGDLEAEGPWGDGASEERARPPPGSPQQPRGMEGPEPGLWGRGGQPRTRQVGWAPGLAALTAALRRSGVARGLGQLPGRGAHTCTEALIFLTPGGWTVGRDLSNEQRFGKLRPKRGGTRTGSWVSGTPEQDGATGRLPASCPSARASAPGELYPHSRPRELPLRSSPSHR